jgi:hypothetical protein
MSSTAVQQNVNCFVRAKNKQLQIQEACERFDNTFTLVLSLMFSGTSYIIKTQNTKTMGFLFCVSCTVHCTIIQYNPKNCTFVTLGF